MNKIQNNKTKFHYADTIKACFIGYIVQAIVNNFVPLGGDIGCSGGPAFAGMISSAAGGDLHMGILEAVVFPVLMLSGVCILKKSADNRKSG